MTMLRTQGVSPFSAPEAPRPVERPRPSEAPAPVGGGGGGDFASMLGDALADAGAAERSSNDASKRFAEGDPSVGIHEVVIAAEKANIAVRYAVTLKNRAIEAYRDLLNTPV